MMTLKAGDHVVVSDDVYGGNKKKNERVKNSVKKTAFLLSKNVSYQEKSTTDEIRSKACERAMNFDN